jgi:hypothetical protein
VPAFIADIHAGGRPRRLPCPADNRWSTLIGLPNSLSLVAQFGEHFVDVHVRSISSRLNCAV